MRTLSIVRAAAAAMLLLPAVLPAQSARDRAAERREAAREARRAREEERREREREREEARRDREEDDEDHDDVVRGRRGESARIDTIVPLGRSGEADLSLLAGRITVKGWDRAEARVQAESEAGSLRLESAPSRLRLREDRHGGGGDDTHSDVTVPSGTRVVMRTTSGDVATTDVRGEVEAHTTSGDLRIEGAAGRTLFETVSGSVEARNLTGPVRGNAVSGDVRVDRVAGDVEIETVSGQVLVNQARSTFVRLESTSGDLDFAGALERAGRYEMNSHSGTITLALPSDVGAQVSIETFSGDLDTAFPLTLTPNAGHGRPRQFEFTLGGGGARVTAESFSGDIVLRRAAQTGGSTTPRE
jgi:hypothetical protein